MCPCGTVTYIEGYVAPICVLAYPSTWKIMDYTEKLEKLNKHIAENPKDYQSVIARMKTYSDAVEHEMYLKRIERLKRVAEYRRAYEQER